MRSSTKVIFWIKGDGHMKSRKAARNDVFTNLCSRFGAPIIEHQAKSMEMLFVQWALQIFGEYLLQGIKYSHAEVIFDKDCQYVVQ